MYGFSGRQWIASMSSSSRAVSRASVVLVERREFAFPFKALVLDLAADAADAEVVLFFVAMLLAPPAACDKMTAVCLAFIHRTGKGSERPSDAHPVPTQYSFR